ncbi:MAG TPA: peptide-binding protein [Cyanobacteria bacterium UBA11162]|nr:peptide-binding protein [Cyanobacteria bacterium UBA12227]HAX89078.1 peptide-binding protein [Cyanobacteria bacterium UBA11370]HBL13556.1 peptide-binding protein [Cyanobacteria bacterium UBA11162]HBY77359.1 peptide-binding protein [Cyanobacteria bacterium UBA11148]
MIVCPNCNHQNPDGATQCEACYTPLPATTSCPNCGAMVQTDASFCGQCGFNLKIPAEVGGGGTSAPDPSLDVPDLLPPDPLVEPEPISTRYPSAMPDPVSPIPATPIPATIVSQPENPDTEQTIPPDLATVPPPPEPVATPPSRTSPPPSPAAGTATTQLQVYSAHLMHLQTNTRIELPSYLTVIHIGKPNDQIPPDIDVSGYPNSEIVSRIHADIRVEGDTYYIEDVGSSNGTYINHAPLAKGNRHRLRTGDRISLGKGDQVTFLFHSS